MFWNPVSKAKYWYTPILEWEGDKILRMKQVLMVDVKLEEISGNNKLPKGCNKKKGKELGALRIWEENIDGLIEEIRRRDQFDEEFDINSNEPMTYTNEVEEIGWSLLTLGPKSRLTGFPCINTKYTKGWFLLFFALMSLNVF